MGPTRRLVTSKILSRAERMPRLESYVPEKATKQNHRREEEREQAAEES